MIAGGPVTIGFPEFDVSVSEASTAVTAGVRLTGDNAEIVTIQVVPLTLSQYQANPGRYMQGCDSQTGSTTDQAEGNY